MGKLTEQEISDLKKILDYSHSLMRYPEVKPNVLSVLVKEYEMSVLLKRKVELLEQGVCSWMIIRRSEN